MAQSIAKRLRSPDGLLNHLAPPPSSACAPPSRLPKTCPRTRVLNAGPASSRSLGDCAPWPPAAARWRRAVEQAQIVVVGQRRFWTSSHRIARHDERRTVPIWGHRCSVPPGAGISPALRWLARHPVASSQERSRTRPPKTAQICPHSGTIAAGRTGARSPAPKPRAVKQGGNPAMAKHILDLHRTILFTRPRHPHGAARRCGSGAGSQQCFAAGALALALAPAFWPGDAAAHTCDAPFTTDLVTGERHQRRRRQGLQRRRGPDRHL